MRFRSFRIRFARQNAQTEKRAALKLARHALAAGTLALIGLTRSPDAGLQAQSSCGPTINPIVCENQKPGDPPAVWDITGAGDPGIQGFATNISVVAGAVEQFKIKTTASNYSIDIYRMGYYSGNGARKIATIAPSAALPQSQPVCLTNSASGLIDCGNWGVSAS